jgi:heat shock protein HslJ
MLRRLLLLALLAVAGCAVGPPLTVAGAPGTSSPPDPTALPGWWRLAGTEQVVLIDPSAIEVLDGGLTLTGTWRADPTGRMVAFIDTLSGSDPKNPAMDAGQGLTPDWLAATAGFRIEGADRVLLDRAGAQVGRLVPEPPVAGSGAVDPGRPIEDADRSRFVPAAPVPAPLVPAAEADLLGRWVPAGSTIGAFAQLDADGTWTGSDGCNGAGGSWVVGTDGGFLAGASSISTLIACDGPAGDPPVDVGAQLGATRRVALDGAELVLLDAAGTEVGRYRRG